MCTCMFTSFCVFIPSGKSIIPFRKHVLETYTFQFSNKVPETHLVHASFNTLIIWKLYLQHTKFS